MEAKRVKQFFWWMTGHLGTCLFLVEGVREYPTTTTTTVAIALLTKGEGEKYRLEARGGIHMELQAPDADKVIEQANVLLRLLGVIDSTPKPPLRENYWEVT